MVTVRRKRGFRRSQVVVKPTLRCADEHALAAAATAPPEREEYRGSAGGAQRGESERRRHHGNLVGAEIATPRNPSLETTSAWTTLLRQPQSAWTTHPQTASEASTTSRSPTCNHGGHRRRDEGDDAEATALYHQGWSSRWRGLDQAREGGIQGAHPGAAACSARAPPPVLTRRRRAAAARSTSKSTRRRATSGLRSRRRTRPARGGRARCGPSTTRSSTSSTWSSTFP